jgi:hypothetical protein
MSEAYKKAMQEINKVFGEEIMYRGLKKEEGDDATEDISQIERKGKKTSFQEKGEEWAKRTKGKGGQDRALGEEK